MTKQELSSHRATDLLLVEEFLRKMAWKITTICWNLWRQKRSSKPKLLREKTHTLTADFWKKSHEKGFQGFALSWLKRAACSPKIFGAELKKKIHFSFQFWRFFRKTAENFSGGFFQFARQTVTGSRVPLARWHILAWRSLAKIAYWV